MNQKKIFVKSYGCQMNVYDSNKIKDLFHNKGYSPTSDIDQADIIVLNTCHIREKAAEKVYSDIGRIEKKRLRNLSLLNNIDYALVYKGKILNQNKKSSYGYIHGKKLKTPYIPLDIFKNLKINFYFKGFEYKDKIIPELKFLKQNKIKIKYGPKKNIFSSSKILSNENKK